MGRPFKLAGETKPRDEATGRFQPKPPTPPEIFQRAREENRQPLDVVSEVRVADHPTPKNDPRASEEIEREPYKEPGLPFRLK